MQPDLHTDAAGILVQALGKAIQDVSSARVHAQVMAGI